MCKGIGTVMIQNGISENDQQQGTIVGIAKRLCARKEKKEFIIVNPSGMISARSVAGSQLTKVGMVLPGVSWDSMKLNQLQKQVWRLVAHLVGPEN